jgi:D-glycero-D-manno-heptose 1,7-bisphosphate phosphatase
VRHWDQFRLLPETVEWIRRFNALDAPVIVVTNQRGVSRGIVEPAELESIHENMRAAVAARGGRIDDVFCCPHEENACQCRKPLPGLVWRAAEKWSLDVPRSVLLGDSWRDRELAAHCGMRFVEVREGRVLQAVPGHEPVMIGLSGRWRTASFQGSRTSFRPGSA